VAGKLIMHMVSVNLTRAYADHVPGAVIGSLLIGSRGSLCGVGSEGHQLLKKVMRQTRCEDENDYGEHKRNYKA
jgi:hypothetical protein